MMETLEVEMDVKFVTHQQRGGGSSRGGVLAQVIIKATLCK